VVQSFPAHVRELYCIESVKINIMPLQIGNTYNLRGIGRVQISRGTAKGKKKKATRLSDGKVVQWGASGYRIAPGTPRGDNYCSRSRGLNKRGFNPNTMARTDWHCRGAKSMEKLIR